MIHVRHLSPVVNGWKKTTQHTWAHGIFPLSIWSRLRTLDISKMKDFAWVDEITTFFSGFTWRGWRGNLLVRFLRNQKSFEPGRWGSFWHSGLICVQQVQLVHLAELKRSEILKHLKGIENKTRALKLRTEMLSNVFSAYVGVCSSQCTRSLKLKFSIQKNQKFLACATHKHGRNYIHTPLRIVMWKRAHLDTHTLGEKNFTALKLSKVTWEFSLTSIWSSSENPSMLAIFDRSF